MQLIIIQTNQVAFGEVIFIQAHSFCEFNFHIIYRTLIVLDHNPCNCIWEAGP